MRSRTPQKWYSFGVAIIGVIIAINLLAFSHLFYLKKNLIEFGEHLLYELDVVGNEVEDVFSKIENRGINQCTDKDLLMMRQLEFLSSSVRNIGLIKDGQLACTTGLGRLKEPTTWATPTYTDRNGLEYFVDLPIRLFEGHYKALAVSNGKHALVLSIERIENVSRPPYVWEHVFEFEGSVQYATGTKGIYEQVNINSSKLLGYLPDPRFYGCSKKYIYHCVAVAYDREAFALINLPLYGVAITFCLAVAIACFTMHQNRIRRLHSNGFRIKHALKHEGYYWLAQPIVRTGGNQVVGCEILGRFEDQYGPLPPFKFIPLLKEQGLNWQYTEKMICSVIEDMEAIPDLPEGFRVSFNIFPRDFKDDESINRLLACSCVQNTRFTIVLEIVEDESLELAEVQNNLRRLRNAGFIIAIDDFGTGFSNLRMLKEVQCDILKIDRSFVMEMEEKSIRSTLIPHIMEIATQLDMNTVAEGVEKHEQAEQLAELGVSHLQGYLFGKPMKLTDLARQVQENEPAVEYVI
ncbi:cyclic diguanylate phosphodiesterase [Aestuariicella sp. G3-2]|uniref:EAL domain-containing protein n=1 Tax=Pseudomaricurvus albidus TaxID=2842452 RepID=UPI001C0C6CD5|nr:EAL domain-containing protein [Aestuariicella albida]MBU3070769.1 cyclic diguanylate phosphodiesterase [Aestuariicella albida]